MVYCQPGVRSFTVLFLFPLIYSLIQVMENLYRLFPDLSRHPLSMRIFHPASGDGSVYLCLSLVQVPSHPSQKEIGAIPETGGRVPGNLPLKNTAGENSVPIAPGPGKFLKGRLFERTPAAVLRNRNALGCDSSPYHTGAGERLKRDQEALEARTRRAEP